jgi:DNA-directed RNA polymerase subunit beta
MGSPLERNPHKFLGEELLSPNIDKVDGSRINMWDNHLTQLLTINEAEPPKIFTNFENQVGSYSSAFKKAENDFTVLKMFVRNDNNVVIIIRDHKTKKLDIIKYNSTVNLTENYGYEMEFTHIPDEGEIVKKGELLYRNNMYDDELNLQIGANLKAVFMAFKGLTYEDGILISESTAKTFTHTEVTEMVVMLNNNDVLINYYGDESIYKPFPSLGERTKDGILCSRRRIDYDNILDKFKSANFDSIMATDQIFFIEGEVDDIEIYSNFGEKEEEFLFNAPIVELKNQQDAFYFSLYEFLEPLKKTENFSDDLNHIFQYAKDYLNPDLKFSLDNTEFEGVILKFKIKNRKPANVGSKFTGRCGNKGVVSKILPDDQMPTTEDGSERADIVLNLLGVNGRMNFSQLYEQELNFVSNQLIKKYRHNKEELFQNIMYLISLVSETQYEFLDNYFNDVKTEKEKKAKINSFCNDLLEGGISLHQPPYFENMTFEGMMAIYEWTGIEKLKFKGIHDPMVIGEIYFIKLKHEAAGKLSARSSGPVSLLNVPYKNNDSYKKGNALYSNAAIRFGEQESLNMMLLKKPKGVINFLKAYSSSDKSRKHMIQTIFRNDIKNVNSVVDKDDNSRSNASETVRALFSGTGIDITSDTDGNITGIEVNDLPE